MLTLDFVLETLAESEGLTTDYVCDFLCDEEEEVCRQKCDWCVPQKECWRRYFERLENETH